MDSIEHEILNDIQIRRCKPEEEKESWELEDKVWGTFNQAGEVWADYIKEMHLVAIDSETSEMLGTIDGTPFDWDGVPASLPNGGWADVVRQAIGFGDNPEKKAEAQWAAAIGTSIEPAHQGRGLAQKLLEALKKEVLAQGYKGLVAPVRPTERWRMPSISIEEYADTRLEDGRHFDPWVRIHEKIGGEIIGICPASAVFKASHKQWEEWAGMRLPKTGDVLVPGAINFLRLENQRGILKEDSIWIKHS